MHSWLQKREISTPRPNFLLLGHVPLVAPVRHISVDQAIQFLASSRVVVKNDQTRSRIIISFLGRTGQTLKNQMVLDYSPHLGLQDIDVWDAQDYIHNIYQQLNLRQMWSIHDAAMQIDMVNSLGTILGPFIRSTWDKDTYAYVMQRPPNLAGGKSYLFSVIEVTQDQLELFYFDTETPEWGNNEDISAEWFTERYWPTTADRSVWSLPCYYHSRRNEQWYKNVKHQYAIVESEMHPICSFIQSRLSALLPAIIFPADPS